MLCPPLRMPTSLSMQQPTHQKYVSIACQGLHSLLDSGSSGVVQPDHGGSNHGSLIHDLGMNTNSSVLTQLSWTPKHICLPSWASLTQHWIWTMQSLWHGPRRGAVQLRAAPAHKGPQLHLTHPLSYGSSTPQRLLQWWLWNLSALYILMLDYPF